MINENLKVAMIYYGSSPHPSHEGFAEAIGADILSCNSGHESSKYGSIIGELKKGIYLDYDVIISEGSRPLITSSLQSVFNDSKLIYLCADQFFYNLSFDSSKTIFHKLEKKAQSSIFNYNIDGIIAVSEFAAEFMRCIVGSSVPIQVVHPFIQWERFDDLNNATPNLESQTAITISSAPSGTVGQYKGVDLLVKAWKKVRQEYPNATLLVVGKGHPESYEDTEGVVVEGYVDSISDVIQEASVYVQPSRADTYPVAVLEALRAGLPTVVTRTTGNRSEIRTIDPNLVADPSVESLAETVKNYFQMSIDEKSNISAISAQRGERYRPDVWKPAFRRSFYSMISDI